MGRRTDEFAEFFAARFGPARRIAYTLCGDWTEAEEIAQATFVKVYAHWGRLRPESADAYLRTALTRTFLDGHRRNAARTRPMAEVPDSPDPAAPVGLRAVDERDALQLALREVPPRQRAVLVLRFVHDQSVEQVAAALGCTTGTVKSQTARGLTALRTAYAATQRPLPVR
jgi:RNA polymerase sigma-70 factor (sigma-E family)